MAPKLSLDSPKMAPRRPQEGPKGVPETSRRGPRGVRRSKNRIITNEFTILFLRGSDDLNMINGSSSAILTYLPRSWAILGPILGHLGAVLGPSWGHFPS